MGAGDHQDRRLPLLAGTAGAALGVLPLDRLPVGRVSRRRFRSRSGSGLVSQFLPVVGTYIAGLLPVLITFLDSPVKAAIGARVSSSSTNRSRTTSSRRASPPARWSCTRPLRSVRRWPGSRCSARQGRSWRCPPRRCCRRSSGDWGERHEVIETELTSMTVPEPLADRRRRNDGAHRPAPRLSPGRGRRTLRLRRERPPRCRRRARPRRRGHVRGR